MAFPVFDVTQPRSGSTLVAVGDGMADDTAAIQDRLDEASSNARGTVYFPPGNYRITQTLHKSNLQPVTIRGEGFSSRLNWTFDGDLFVWDNSATDTHIHDLAILATVDMQPTSTAFNLVTGASHVSIVRVKIDVDDPSTKKFGSGIRVAVPGANPDVSLAGDLRCEDLFFWRFRGTAIELKDATDVRIRGCRFPAIDRPLGSIGVHLAGNTGGVWIQDCDLVEVDYCILVDRTEQRAFNRELFVTGSACDVGEHGLVIRDKTYVTTTGAWFASCNSENVLVEEGFDPIVEITGGIVFNAGSLNTAKTQPFAHHGLIIRSGELAMSGVMVNNNAGVGLIVSDDVRGYTVSGCTFIDNWHLGADFGASCGTIVGNTFLRNGFQSQIGIVRRFLEAVTTLFRRALGTVTPRRGHAQDSATPSRGNVQYQVRGSELTLRTTSRASRSIRRRGFPDPDPLECATREPPGGEAQDDPTSRTGSGLLVYARGTRWPASTVFGTVAIPETSYPSWRYRASVPLGSSITRRDIRP